MNTASLQKKKIDPLNMRLPPANKSWIRGLRPVSKLNIFVSSSRNFDPDGLFSTEIFGMQGTPERISKPSYIDLKIPYINQTIFKGLIRASKLYEGIMQGRSYAIFDKKTKNFIKEAPGVGETGYAFFIQHIHELKVPETPGVTRQILIKQMAKYQDSLTMDYLMVIPAGIRDYTIDDSGKPSEDDINKMYRKVLSGVNLTPENAKPFDPAMDNNRYHVQVLMAEIYDYIMLIIYGKKKFANMKVSSRRVHGGTKNVLTSMLQGVGDMDSPAMPTVNHTFVGLFQAMKGGMALATHGVATGPMSRIVPGVDAEMRMVDPKTLKSVPVAFDYDFYKSWFTLEGVNKIVNSYRDESNRDLTMRYKGYYYCLLYKDATTIHVLHDIDDLPEGLNADLVEPIGLTDLLYISVYHTFQDRTCTVTRYPVNGEGGIYPSMVYLKPTTDTIVAVDPDNQSSFNTFPDIQSGYFNSVSVSGTHLTRLGADFDGDKVSVIISATQESIAEIMRFFTLVSSYIAVDGTALYSCITKTTRLVLSHITGDPE